MRIRDELPCKITSRCLAEADTRKRLMYELLEQIGEGGMATVYRAIDLNPPPSYREKHGDKPRIVAIKYMLEDVYNFTDDGLDRFVREAKFSNRVHHPHLVRLINVGVDQEARPFFVMEYVDGARNLSQIRELYALQLLRAQAYNPATARIQRSLVPLDFMLDVVRQFLDALGELHKHGIVHRDIKPDNVMVTKYKGRDYVKLADLGISKSLEHSEDSVLTRQDVVVGTPNYMSPEAATVGKCLINDDTGMPWFVGPYSDIWSCGVMLYELITGRLPFTAEAGELPPDDKPRTPDQEYRQLAQFVLAKVINPNSRHPPMSDFVDDLNPYLVELVDACLAKNPWDRPAGVGRLQTMLDKVEQYELEREGGLADPDDSERAPVQSVAPVPLRPAPKAQSAPVRLILKPPSRHFASSSISRPIILAFGLAAVLVVAFILWPWLSEKAYSAPAAPQFVSAVAPSSVPLPSSSAETALPVASAKRHPDSGPLAGSRPFQIFQRGADAAKAGDCRTASSNMNAVLAVYPAFPKPFRILGDCARKAGKSDEARQYYEKYLSFEGVDPLPPEAR